MVVEGDLDARVAERLIGHVGGVPGNVYGLRGRDYVATRAPNYQHAAQHIPFLVVMDLDRNECAPSLLQHIGVQSGENLCMRVAVRSIEAWLLADRDGFARWFRLSSAALPANPDDLPEPKAALLAAVQRSRSRTLKDDLLPRPNSGRRVGSGYVGTLTQFVSVEWDPSAAALNSPSLSRALACLHRLTGAWH